MTHDEIREQFTMFLLAVSIGLNIGLAALLHDAYGYPTIRPAEYIDGTEANELLDAGFIIVDPNGDVVERFLPDGSHITVDDIPVAQVSEFRC